MAKADLLLEGGGAKGIALAGAVHRLMADYAFERVAGTSAGAIVAALVAAGIERDDIHPVLDTLDYSRIPDRGWPGVPLLSEGVSLLFERGAYEGDYLFRWLYTTLRELGVETFADLRRDDRGDDPNLRPEQRYSLMVTATDVTRGLLLHLPWDYRTHFDRDPDKQLVAGAVRASMSIPLFFEPVVLRDLRTGMKITMVDGGVLSNFPVEILDRTDPDPPRWPTFGVKLLPALPETDSSLVPLWCLSRIPPVRLLEQVIATSIVGRDQTYLARPCVARRTMTVDTDAVHLVEFGLTEAQQAELFGNGVSAADEFLDRWDWRTYLAECRTTGAARTAVRTRRK